MDRVIGIDLAGSPRRNTGYAVLQTGNGIVLEDIGTIHTDDEIFALTKRYSPDLIAIDAPLSLPRGRTNIHDRDDHHFRVCDLQLRERGIRFFPITLGPMRKLTERGMMIANKLKRKGYDVIEVFPGATYDRLSLPRKDKERIKRWIFKLTGKRLGEVSQDELDGFACAYTGYLYLIGDVEVLGDPGEGLLIIPKG